MFKAKHMFFYSSNYGGICLYSSEYSVNKAMVFVACEYRGVWKTKVFHCSQFCGIYKAIISSESIADVQAKVFDSVSRKAVSKQVCFWWQLTVFASDITRDTKVNS